MSYVEGDKPAERQEFMMQESGENEWCPPGLH